MENMYLIFYLMSKVTWKLWNIKLEKEIIWILKAQILSFEITQKNIWKSASY